MTAAERNALLSQWIKPSSESEQDRQDRAERMVADAIEAHPAFKGTPLAVYAKGSYANNTNVRVDSDVDIVVENRDCFFYEYFGDFTPPTTGIAPYSGPWNSTNWRTEITKALTNCFGASEVASSGAVALVIAEKPGSRPSTDVIPSFRYYRYDDPNRRLAHEGSKVFKRDSGSIINWPKQQLDNGRRKNSNTNRRYKNFVRALKNAENYLVRQDTIKAKPSYLMECLVWNVPDATLVSGDLDAGFRATLVWLWQHLTDQYVYKDWEEPNQLKYLFGSGQKWTVDDAKQVVLETWRLLDY